MLELDGATIVFQMINFVILAALLYWLLFKPTMRAIKQRAVEKERLVRELERERQTFLSRRATLDEKLSRFEEETANALALAHEQAEAERVELLRQARAEVEQILVEAQTDAYRIRRQAVDTFHDDLIDAILDISGLIIRNTISLQVHDALVRQLADRVWELGRTDIQRVEILRQSLGDREPTAHILTAEPLTRDHQGLLARTLTALADRHVNLEARADPRLVAGIRVRIGDIVVDSSISGQLDELRDQAAAALREQIAHE